MIGFESEIYRHKTRERIWISENAHVVRDEHGVLLYYEGTVEEITDRVRDREALRNSREQLQQIVDVVPGALYRVEVQADGRAVTTFVSPRVQELFGVTPAQAIADTQAMNRARHPDDVARVQAELHEIGRAHV